MANNTAKKDVFRAGTYRESFYGKEYAYRSFVPTPVNRQYTVHDTRVFTQMEEAARQLAELNAFSYLVPDIDFFISMHVRNEAVKSSKIEGTRTGVDEVILEEQDIKPERRDDWKEVHNHIRAMHVGIEELSRLPLCMRLLRKVHDTLMREVRGEEKQPGKVRKTQNWIGGTSIKTASFIPPHADDLPAALKDLEAFLNNTRNLDMPKLLQVAITHYQFETIHPFNDGNGRVGRILIVLQLLSLGMLERPALYLSDFFEQHKGEYYTALTMVREQHDMDQWLLFFLSGVAEAAKKGKKTLKSIVDLHAEYREKVVGFGRSAKTAHALLSFAFSTPAFEIKKAAKGINVSEPTANSVVKKLVEAGIVKEATGFSRNRIFVLHEYVNLFKR